jgi:hypothetical protein
MKYFRVVPALPFYITKNNDEDLRIPLLGLKIKIRGENFKEHLLTKYLGREVELHPTDQKNSFIKKVVTATITDKYLLFDDVVVYTIDLKGMNDTDHKIFVLKPKMSGISQIGYRYPIEGLYSIGMEDHLEDLALIDHEKLKFLEWVYLKPDHNN